MGKKPYGMTCPITRASEILEPRWTIPIIVALWAGKSKFNDVRREIGSISPALLSRRLKELELLGLVERVEDKGTGSVDYLRTEAAIALEDTLNTLATWGQRFIKAELALCTAKASNLMCKLRELIRRDELPDRRVLMRFNFNDPGLTDGTYWVSVRPGEPVELCTTTRHSDVDLFVETNTPSLLGIIQNRTSLQREIDLGETFVTGDAVLMRTMSRWLPRSDYSDVEGIAQLPDRRGWPAVAAE